MYIYIYVYIISSHCFGFYRTGGLRRGIRTKELLLQQVKIEEGFISGIPLGQHADNVSHGGPIGRARFCAEKSHAKKQQLLLLHWAELHDAPTFWYRTSAVPSFIWILERTQSTMCMASPNSESTKRLLIKISSKTTQKL